MVEWRNFRLRGHRCVDFWIQAIGLRKDHRGKNEVGTSPRGNASFGKCLVHS